MVKAYMTMTRKRSGLVFAIMSLIGLSGVLEASFDEKRKTASSAIATQTEKAMLDLLKTGIAEGKPTEAVAITRQWLNENVTNDPMLLYQAGRAAELSGDWRGGVALYQQFLKRADLASDAAADAVQGVYTLLIDKLNDEEGAYAYMKSDGNRLHVCNRAPQFDQWFFNLAMKRRDHEAIAGRLLACARNPAVTDDMIVVRYEPHFRWLLHQINVWRLDVPRMPESFVADVKSLAASIEFDDELKLLLNWAVSVKQYNMNVLDGKSTDLPTPQASRLLQRYPRYAEYVQTGWAGGHRRRHYRDDPRKYWPLDLEAKMKPVRNAVKQLSPVELAAYQKSLGQRYYDGGPQLVKDPVAFVRANREIVNSKTGPRLTFDTRNMDWKTISELALLLKHNPSADAAIIRALFAAGQKKDYDKAMNALLGPEAWRLTRTDLDGRLADALWHICKRPGGNKKRDQEKARSKKLTNTLKKEELKATSPATQRMDRFKKLWADWRSNDPKMPNVYERLVSALSVTPEAVPQLLTDESVLSQQLLREVMSKGFEGPKGPLSGDPNVRGLSSTRYEPSINRKLARHRNNKDYIQKRLVGAWGAYPLEPALRKAVSDQLARNKLKSWVVMAWINAQFMENNEASHELMGRLFKSPAFKTLPYEVRYGARQWFKRVALTPAQMAIVHSADPKRIFKGILTLNKQSDATAVASALSSAIKGMHDAPVRLQLHSAKRLRDISDGVLSDPKVMAQLIELAGPMRYFPGNDYDEVQFTERFWNAFKKSQVDSPVLLHQLAPYFWRHTELYHRSLSSMIEYSGALSTRNASAASAWARSGLQTIARHKRGHTYFKAKSDIPKLKAIRGKAAMAMGLLEIPVRKNHPAYPIYQSQAEFATGNAESALELYEDHAQELMPVHRDLTVSYLIWILDRRIDARDREGQETLVKALQSWRQESTTAFTSDQKIALDLAYGEIAMQRGMLPEAYKIFAGAQKNQAYEGMYAQHTAGLKKVEVQRLSKDFDGALQTLVELASHKIPKLTTDVHYARAEVYYDMEEFDDAAEQITEVLERDPDHPDATILRGRVQLKLKRLIEATEVELGSVSRKQSLVPGESLKVTLVDPTLSVSSGGSDIEVTVWSTSGDREDLMLRQFGDEKTKYRGEMHTQLGKPVKGDRVLQVIGEDKIYYAYSERFRAKMPKLEENRGGPISVASDAMLMASARKLLSENEQRVADMEAVTAALKKNEQSATNVDPEKLNELKTFYSNSSRQRMLQTQLKPGNKIHLRVIDKDRGRTASIDELTVSVASSSGDSVSRITLKETDTHSGQFEGHLQTTVAQAMALASSTEAGRNPSAVISPRRGYDAWRPIHSDRKKDNHWLMVDLNDNASLSKLEIDASDAGFGLKSFLVQTATSPTQWTTVAGVPHPVLVKNPWAPSVTVVRDTQRRTPETMYGDIRRYLTSEWMHGGLVQGAARNVSGPSQALPGTMVPEKWKRGRHDNPQLVYRFQGWFYEPEYVTRRFRLKLGAMPSNASNKKDKQKDRKSVRQPTFFLTLNGRPLSGANGMEGEMKLRAGLHKLEIWASGWAYDSIGFGRSVRLEANLDEPEKLVNCPDSFFDPSSFPDDVLDHKNAPATLKANEDKTKFTVDFAKGSRARLIRLVFIKNQGQVPSINRLTLTGADSKTLLPVARDFGELRKNDVLEILSGDKITVRYVDDRYVTKGRQKHERYLSVAYSDGAIEFADIEPRAQPGRREKKSYYERLLRFQHNKPFSVVVNDPDMDVSVEPDELEVTAIDGGGNRRSFVAKETGASTGTFRVFITPVAAKTSEAGKIHIPAGGDLRVIYKDVENNRPGVPVERVAVAQHAEYKTPRLEMAHLAVQVAEGGETETLNSSFIPDLSGQSASAREEAVKEQIRTRYEIKREFLDVKAPPAGGFEMVHGRLALIDVIAPHLAVGTASTMTVYLQTDSGRKKAGGIAQPGVFDTTVPGTMRIEAPLGKTNAVQPGQLRSGYRVTWENDGMKELQRIDAYRKAGRFRVQVPLIAGELPRVSLVDKEKLEDLDIDMPHGLTVRTGERIHVGIPYKDQAGQVKWATGSAKVITHPMLDVMHEDYRNLLTQAFVGEQIYLRIIDLAEDRTDDRDSLRCFVASKNGQKHYVILRESDVHTGIFKGNFQLAYQKEKQPNQSETRDIRMDGFPVVYGDTVAARYTDAAGNKTPAYYVTIGRGSDGTVFPFSKRYDDSHVAMRTQFAMAESFLELARRHRKMKEETAAQREFTRAKQLLSNAVSQFTDPETRAQAEYLLGGLTQEDAEATTDKDLQEQRYRAALARFMTITSSYGDTEWASRAQFKIAGIYERLNEPEIAAQEYVKLAYKHPDSEHLATAMARLGTHFQRKAVGYERKAAPFLTRAKANPDDKDAVADGEAMQKMATIEYIKSAQIFERLQTRFPDHDLAGKAGLRAGQIYMRAKENRSAITALMSIVNNESYDGPTLRSEAMYWTARCHEALRDSLSAYALYKRITYDFPESKWAAYARAQLSTEALLRLDQKLEIERLEEGR